MTDHETLEGWLDAYKRAWEDRDPEEAAALFTADATYHETPFDEPLRGRDGVFEYWSDVTRTQRDVRVVYEILAPTEKGGVVHWGANFSTPQANDRIMLDGILLVELDADGRCTEFREWWHKHEEKAS